MRKQVLIAGVVLSASMSAWLTGQESKQRPDRVLPEKIEAARTGRSGPLVDIPVRAKKSGPPRAIRNFTHSVPMNRHAPRLAGPDELWQAEPFTSEASIATPAAIVSFDGTSDQDNEDYAGVRVVPPDTQGDVGPNHYVQMTNLVFKVFNKDGSTFFGPYPNNIFWQGFGGVCETNNDGDPVVLYDHLAGVWVFAQFGLGEYSPFIGEADGHMCVAVSTGSDPSDPLTSSYNLYDFVVSPSLDGGFLYFAINDYPKMGVWTDGYYLTFNEFQCNVITGQCPFQGAVVAVLEKEKMTNGQGQAPQGLRVTLPPTQSEAYFSLQPSHLEGPPPPDGTPNTIVMAFDDETWGSGQNPDGYRLWEFSVDWNDPVNNSTFTDLGQVDTTEFDADLCGFADCVPQPAPGENLDTLSQFTMFRAQYRHFGDYDTIVGNHTVDVDGTDTAGIRWFELRKTSPATWTLHQTGTYAPADGDHRWMGSAAMDGSGNIALSFSVSSNFTNPALRYVSRSAGDPLDLLPGGEASCVEGAGVQTNSQHRWGDYSSISVDPTDDCTFWLTNEYYDSTGGFDFNTRICAFQLPGCGVCDPSPEVCNGVDDDCDGEIDEGFDADGDGYTSCGGDCNDADPTINPGAAESCNGIDDDCSGAADEPFDADGDTYTTCAGDCDDNSAAVNPGAAEVCNSIDDNCDGSIDEGFDLDGDGYSTCQGDCDDGSAAVSPGTAEVCNSIDDNCDGSIDEGFDLDGDNYSTCQGDCDDGNASVNPEATEVCNGIDDDCSGAADEPFDLDGDNFTTCAGDCNDGDPAVNPGATESCNAIDDNCNFQIDEGFDQDGDGFTTCQNDCNDANPAVNPGALELCNGIDDNCDGQVDEDLDADGDGFTICGGDCNDNDPNVSPDATEVCNGVDDNCNFQIDEGFDQDGDGFTTCENDCNDADPAVSPAAAELCNGVDDNCSGEIDEGFDVDGDGFRVCDGDCNDGDPAINPGAGETCGDGVDNNCDGLTDGQDPVCVSSSPPAAPTNLNVSGQSSGKGSNRVVWVIGNFSDNSNNENSFSVRRAVKSGKGRNAACGTFSEILTLPADQAAFEDNSVQSNTTYCYQVFAINAVGFSSSNVAEAKTPK